MKKRNSTIDRTIAERIPVERYEFYRTAIISFAKLQHEKADVNTITILRT